MGGVGRYFDKNVIERNYLERGGFDIVGVEGCGRSEDPLASFVPTPAAFFLPLQREHDSLLQGGQNLWHNRNT